MELISKDIIRDAINKGVNNLFAVTNFDHSLNLNIQANAIVHFKEPDSDLAPAGVLIRFFQQSIEFHRHLDHDIPEGVKNMFSNIILQELRKIPEVDRIAIEAIAPHKCPICENGRADFGNGMEPCDACDGTGRLTERQLQDLNSMSETAYGDSQEKPAASKIRC